MAVIAIRLPNELIDQIDEWGAERGMTRSESIRRWIKNGVDERWRPLKQKPASRTQTRAKAAALAAETLDRHTDRSAPPEEQASRKRRLLKGPKEFREIRKDHKRQRKPALGTRQKDATNSQKCVDPSPGVKPNIPQVAAKSGKHAQLRLCQR